MNKKISITIPVYNVEPQFIETAINSVLNQTYKNIELIVVNDGSSDKFTINYLQSINNSMIKIIHQDNKGLGGARNTGIENSTGEYIGFLDADDWLDAKFYEVLLELCEKNSADIACGTLIKTGINHQEPIDDFDNNAVSNFIEKMRYITNGSTCSKLFKKELFSKIRFKQHTYFEDNPVLLETLAKSNKVIFTNKVNYYYRENPNSICLNFEREEKRKIDKLYILENIFEIINNKTLEEKEAVLNVFVPILVDRGYFNFEKEYRNKVINLLGENYKKYTSKFRNSFIENVFSLRNAGKTYKIITILWMKFKIKRKPQNHALDRLH